MKLHGFSICVDKEILSMKVSMPIDWEFDRAESKVGILIFAKKSIDSVLIYQTLSAYKIKDPFQNTKIEIYILLILLHKAPKLWAY